MSGWLGGPGWSPRVGQVGWSGWLTRVGRLDQPDQPGVTNPTNSANRANPTNSIRLSAFCKNTLRRRYITLHETRKTKVFIT